MLCDKNTCRDPEPTALISGHQRFLREFKDGLPLPLSDNPPFFLVPSFGHGASTAQQPWRYFDVAVSLFLLPSTYSCTKQAIISGGPTSRQWRPSPAVQLLPVLTTALHRARVRVFTNRALKTIIHAGVSAASSSEAPSLRFFAHAVRDTVEKLVLPSLPFLQQYANDVSP